MLAHNPSAFTYYGTQTYFIGEQKVAVIDPGPDLPEHVDALVDAIAGRPVAAIMCTHTHRDHSPASRALAERLAHRSLAARLWRWRRSAHALMHRSMEIMRRIGCSPMATPLKWMARPSPWWGHRVIRRTISASPIEGALFSGDHVMGWSTTVVVPPDGDMAAYMQSLDKLRRRDDRVYYPAHGEPVTNPQQYVRHLAGHRMQRERQILGLILSQGRDIPDIVANAYPGSILD